MDADRKAALAVADNLSRLMNDLGLTQAEFARKANVGQRTISGLLDVSRLDEINPTITTLEAITSCLGIPVWQLLIPDLPIELLKSRSLGQVLTAYRDASPDGRANINRIAEAEVRYSRISTGDKP